MCDPALALAHAKGWCNIQRYDAPPPMHMERAQRIEGRGEAVFFPGRCWPRTARTGLLFNVGVPPCRDEGRAGRKPGDLSSVIPHVRESNATQHYAGSPSYREEDAG